MLRIYLCLFISVVFINLLALGYADIPNNRLCADAKCSEAISEAKGSVTYLAKDPKELSFKIGDKLTIISKTDEKDGYWGAKLKDKIGFVPKGLVKEIKIYHPSDQLKFNVPVEKLSDNVKKNTGNDDIKLVPNNSNIEIASSVSELNELESPVDTASFANIGGVSAEVINETSKNYEEIEGTRFYFNSLKEKKEVTPSATIKADTFTKTVESTTPSPVLDSTTQTSNNNLKIEKESVSEKKLEDIEDDDDDDDDEEDYDNMDDEEDDNGGEREDETESQESTENPINNFTTSNEEVGNNADPVATTEKPNESSKSDDLKAETVAQKEKKISEETLNSIGSGWGVLNTVANILSAASNEVESDTSSENTDSILGNTTEENSVVEEAKQNLNANSNENVKENGPTLDLPEKAKENLITERSSEIPPPLVNKNQEKISLDSLNDSVLDFNSKEEISKETVQNVTELPSDSSVSLNENSKNTETVSVENDLSKLVNEQKPAGLPSVLNLGKISEKNFQNVQKNPLPNKEESTTSESYKKEDVPSSSKKEFETTSEVTPTKFADPTTVPNLLFETVKSNEIFSNFVPVSEAAKVEEVTTETYQPKEVESEPPAIEADGESVDTPNDNKINLDLPTEPTIEIPTTVEEIIESETQEQPGYFSNLLETVYDYLGLKQKEEKFDDLSSEIFKDELKDQKIDDSKVEAVPEGNCKSVFGLESNCEDAPLASHNIWDSWYSSSRNMDINATFYSTLLYLIITAVTVLLFTLGYYFIEENRKCSPLIAKVNNLEQQLMVSSAECVLLKDELQSAKDKIVLYEDSSNNELVISLQNELKEAQKIRSELEATIESLQQELDAATEAGLDLNRMLSEVLSQKGGSDSLMESVEHLQAQLDSQQKIIDDMNTSLVMKNQENEGLQVELASANDKIENLEDELNDIKQNLHMLLKEKEDVTGELTSRNNQLQSRISQLTESKEKEILGLRKNNEDLNSQLSSLSEKLIVKEEELNALKESVKGLKNESGRKLDELFDVTRVKAELTKVQKEKVKLQDKLQAAEEAKKLLEERIKCTDSELQKLRENVTEAEKEKIEAQTKLEVLSKYFKEKEMQLQKELGLQEAMWLQKQGDDTTVYERMTSLQEEVENYKSQNEMLKKEILDQERGLKSQIATLEKKAHENWVAARQAERKLEESKQEAAQLRNRLTMIEKNMNNDMETKQNNRLTEEINGGETFSPLMHDASSPMPPFPPLPLDPNNPALLRPGFIPPPMFIPPPGGFMPPPPPFLPGDRRPPPLGRMSSPPLNNRFSPSPDFSMERLSPPLSPPVRNYKSPNEPERDRERFRHRTPPFPSFPPRDWEDSHSSGHSGFRPISSQRESRRDNKGSTLSSGHSSSDSLDKSSRHSGRV